jgi:hypothetical protein
MEPLVPCQGENPLDVDFDRAKELIDESNR